MEETLRMRLAARLFHEIENLICDLYSRWLDESAYEDINDYKKPLLKSFKRARATQITMTRKPFGFTCKIGDATYRYSVTMKAYQYSRIS